MQDDLDDPIPLGAQSAPEPSDPQNDVTAPAAPAPPAPTDAEKQAAFAKFQATDVTVIGEILDRLNKYPFIGSPYDLDIRIIPIDGSQRAPLGRIPFADLLNSPISPPDRLIEIVTDLYHLPTARAQRSYDILVLWRRTGRVYARFRIDLPSPDAIRATRNAEANAQAHRAMPPPPAVGAPPPYYGAPPPARYGAPPPSGALGAPGLPTDQALLIGALQEALNAVREGRQPQAMAAPPPDPTHVLIEQLRAEIAELKAQRAAPAPPPQAMAAPPPAAMPAGPMEQFVRSGTEKMMMSILKVATGAFEKAISSGLGGVPPEVVDAVEEPPAAPPAPPAEPPEPLPFQTIPVSKWSDGREVLYARDSETGDPHWMGIALGNPFLIEKAVAIGESLAQPIIAAVQRKFNTLGETPVREAPPAAAPAPSPRAPPQPAPAAAASPPPPPPPPAGESAWPSM